MIETKEIYSSEKEEINDNLAFGWQATQETSVKTGKTHHMETILAREMNIPHYNEYVQLEKQYYSLKSQFKYYESMEPFTVACYLLFLIIPGVLYIIFRLKKKKKIEKFNNSLKEQMAKTVDQARNLH